MKSAYTLALVLALAAGACKKKEENVTPPTGTSGSAAMGSSAGSAGSGSGSAAAVAAPTEAERAAKALAETETAAAAEKARFTPEITKAVTELAAKAGATKVVLPAILAAAHRKPGNAARDAARHPLETLELFGIARDSTVIELGAGEGWYTELLAPLLAAKGTFIAVGPDAAGPAEKMSTVYGKRLDLLLGKSPELFGKVQRRTIRSPEEVNLGEPGSVDVVIAMRELHGWQRNGAFDKYVAAVHAVLKEGGTFGVEAHRAAAGAKAEDTVDDGYLPEAWVIEKIEAAGFKLAEKSEINANPKDTKDYPDGVWTLPPNLRAKVKDDAKYQAIGESDRMTLKFTKVAAPAAGSGAGSGAPN